jgi:hypothetical protein
MKFSSRAAAAVAALSIVVVAPLSGAHASGLNWKTKVVVSGAKLQLCKAETTKSGPYKVHVRVDASHASGPVTGIATIYKKDKATQEKWATKGYIKPGNISDVGTIKLPQDSNYSVSAGMGAGQMGDGGTFVAKQIPHC